MANSGQNATTRSLRVQRSSTGMQSSSPGRPAPVNQLAAETMEQIFISACPSVNLPGRKPGTLPEKHRSRAWHTAADPLILSMVCRRWYNIMKTHHELWRTINISVYEIKHADWNQWGFFQLRDRLNRSGAQPLQIRIDDGHFGNTATSGILEVIMSHSERWKNVEFDIEMGYELLQKLNSLKGRLPGLESLYVRLPSAAGRSAISRENLGGTFLSAPSLTRVHLGQSVFPMNVLRIMPWTQLLEAVFDHSIFANKKDLREICECLSASVTTLSFIGISFAYEPASTSFSKNEQPITLEKLRRLRLHSDYMGLLNVFICPSLTWLDIEDADENQIIPFFDTSSCALTHIHLCDIRGYTDGKEYYRVFRHPASSTLKSVSLRDLGDGIVDLLVFDSQKRFPYLETLLLHVDLSYDDPTDELPSLTENIQKIVESRTQETSLNHHELTILTRAPQSNYTQIDGPSLLKYCFITIDLDSDRLRQEDGYWDPTLLETFRLFLLSRNVRGRQEIS